MKNLAAIAIAITLIGLASCKGDWRCTCSGTFLGIPYSEDTVFTGVAKKDAGDECDVLEAQLSLFSQDASCKLSKD